MRDHLCLFRPPHRPAHARSTSRGHASLALSLGLAVVGLAAAPGLGQQKPPRSSRPPTPTQVQPAPAAQPSGVPVFNPSPVELSADRWKLESVGLSMFLPADSVTQANSAAGKANAQIAAKNNTWIINVQTPRTANPDTTAAEVCDGIVTEHFRAAGEVYSPPAPGDKAPRLTGVRGKLLDLRRTIKIGGQEAQRVYFAVPGMTPRDPEVVRGITVFKTGNTQFVIFELVTTMSLYDKSRAIYESAIATAEFMDPAQLIVRRATAVSTAQKVLEALTTETLREVFAAQPERWERCYRPAATGADADATELGYRRIVNLIGPRGSMVQGQTSTSGGDNSDGFIVQLDARMLSSGFTLDSSAAYFLSMDRNEEVWTIRNAIRKGGKTDTITEQGARSGKSLVVKVEGSGMTPREVRPVFQNDGYVSRVEATLLPLLLIRAKAAADYGTYTYQSDDATVCFRSDSLEQPPESPGLWKLTTKLSEKQPAMVSFYNAKGDLMRTEMPDGAVWEPVTKEKLMQLWKSKGLPIERARR